MKLIAIVHSCQQHSEDAYESVHRMLELRPETTVQEIMDWLTKGKADLSDERLRSFMPIRIEGVERRTPSGGG